MTMRPCIECSVPTTGTRCPTCQAPRTRARNLRVNAVYGDPRYRRQRALVIGGPCALQLRGCTGIATQADHVVPVSLGGAGGPVRGVCGHCNAVRGNRPDPLAPEGPR